MGSPEGTPMEESHPLRLFYAYILKSDKDGKYYYGHTSNLENRLNYHNTGKVRSTKGKRPLKLHYYEGFNTKQEAVKRELFYKSIKGYNWLKQNKITER